MEDLNSSFIFQELKINGESFEIRDLRQEGAHIFGTDGVN